MTIIKKIFGVPSLMVLATVIVFGSVSTPASAVAIASPSTLPSGVVGTFYSTSLAATGGTAPYRWTWTTCSGACNTGLGFNGGLTSTTGVLNGTPVNAGTSTFTFKVTDSGGATATGSFRIAILSTPPPPPPPTTPTPLAITSSGTLPNGAASTSYNTSLTATGGTTPYNWAIKSCSGVCNAGLSLSPAGVFSGTPFNSGTSTYSVGVIDATGQSASASLNLTIGAGAPSSSTANYFVSPSGSNSNPCTQSSPCATPDYVVNNKAAAGNTVQVAAGTYDFGGSEVHFTKSGTAGNPITLTCATRGACKIQNSITGNNAVVSIGGNYLTFDGFEITNTGPGNNLGIYLGGHDISIIHNIVHDIKTDCAVAGNGGSGIHPNGNGVNNVLIDSNLVYNIAWVSGAPKCDSSIVQNGGILVEMTSSAGGTVTVSNNIVYNVSGGWGISTDKGIVPTIVNNTVFNTVNGGVVINNAPSGSVVENNIIAYTGLHASDGNYYGGVCAVMNGTASSTIYRNNDLFGNHGGNYGAGWSCSGSGLNSGDIVVDPASGTTFVNWKADGSGDYHPKAGSRTIDAGSISSKSPTIDFDGNPRPQGGGQDIGAYEYLN